LEYSSSSNAWLLSLSVIIIIINNIINNIILLGLPDNNIFEGPPAKLFAKFKNSSYFKYIELNHIGHHIMPCNYNVCCPGTDFLFNTHVPEEIWRKKQNLEKKTTTEELVLN